MDEDELDARLIAAHKAGKSSTMAALYREAADMAEAEGDAERAAFFMTHAWIFALEAGDPVAEILDAALKDAGRND